MAMIILVSAGFAQTGSDVVNPDQALTPSVEITADNATANEETSNLTVESIEAIVEPAIESVSDEVAGINSEDMVLTVCQSGCDYSTIQDAIDVAEPGSTVLVLSGIYKESVEIDKQLTLLGVDTGDRKPILDGDGNDNAISLKADGIILKGLEITNSAVGIKVTSSNNIIENNDVRDNEWRGIYLRSSNGNVIENNLISENDYGIRLDESSGNTIANNNVSYNHNGVYLESSSENRLYGNKLLENQNKNIFDDGLNEWDDGIQGNQYGDFDQFEEGCADSDGDGVCDLSYQIPGGSSVDNHPLVQISTSLAEEIAAMIIEPEPEADITVGLRNCDYTSIQRAIDVAEPGDVIEVQSGFYQEIVNVNKQITLRGVNTGEGIPIISAGGGNNSAVTLSADGVVIKGFFITDVAEWPGAGVSIISSNNQISQINVWNNRWVGLYLKGGKNNTISDSVFNNNYDNNVLLYFASGNTIENNVLGNSVKWRGIQLWSSNDNRVINNVISNNYDDGIFLRDSDNSTVQGNVICNNNVSIRILNSEDEGISSNSFVNSNSTQNVIYDS